MNSTQSKKDVELEVGRFFISWLNKENGYDYAKPQAPQNEHTPIDLFAVSKSQSYPQIKLQLCTAERRLQDTMKAARRSPDELIHYMADERDIIDSYVAKSIKYPPAEKSSLILLLHRRHGPLLDNGHTQKLFAHIALSDFAGVYYVRMPSRLETSSHPHTGQVISLKSIA